MSPITSSAHGKPKELFARVEELLGGLQPSLRDSLLFGLSRHFAALRAGLITIAPPFLRQGKPALDAHARIPACAGDVDEAISNFRFEISGRSEPADRVGAARSASPRDKPYGKTARLKGGRCDGNGQEEARCRAEGRGATFNSESKTIRQKRPAERRPLRWQQPRQ
jgi:hypothetical protein